MSDLPPPPPDDSGWSSQPPPLPLQVGPPGAGGVPGARTAPLGTGGTVALASPGTRLTARIVDLLVIMVLGSVLASLPRSVVVSVVVFIAGAAYETAFIATKGQTPGKMVTRIRIVSADGGGNPGWGASAARWALPAIASMARVVAWAVGAEWVTESLLGLAGMLVYASLLWNRRRQGWHDMVAGTLVINTPTQTSLSNRVAIWLGVVLVVLGALTVAGVIWALANFSL